ncbi:MAG: bifunctional UDP-N-acetylglucosamine diphosphorylase/glucosamine-1-phosphate N-acetyltransferase GlmU [Myxococcota bacterium]
MMTPLRDLDFQAVVLAAGKGTRMKSSRVKVLHEVLGVPMIGHTIRAARAAGSSRIALVLGHDRERVRQWFEEHDDVRDLRIAVQREQLGTGHAVWVAREALGGGAPYTLILYGDVPNLSAASISAFVEAAVDSGMPLAVMSAVVEAPGAYGRMVRGASGALERIVEFKDASEAERAITEINAGFYVARTDFLLGELDVLMAAGADNAQGEYYLTDLVRRAAEQGGALGWLIEDVREIQGVNTRADLAQATAYATQRINAYWMAQGVTMIDPARVHIEATVTLEPDVVLYPDVYLHGATHLCEGAVIEHGCTLRDTHIGRGTRLLAGCYCDQAKVAERTNIGPYAHLRPGADIGSECKVGNFVEVKKSRLDDGVKAGHLTYLGDAHIGAGANIGAGTITCNYDGKHKHRTTIGPGVFIGSNSSLVAPVTVGEGAYVGAGSTITEDVPRKALGVGRGRQRNVEGWAE